MNQYLFFFIISMTHKSEDYKISAVKYYLNNKDNIRKTCNIFDYKKYTLQRYKTSKNLTRRNRKSVSYKITKPQVKGLCIHIIVIIKN